MVLLAEVALIKLTTNEHIPLMELLIKVTDQEQLIRKLQDQLRRSKTISKQNKLQVYKHSVDRVNRGKRPVKTRKGKTQRKKEAKKRYKNTLALFRLGSY